MVESFRWRERPDRNDAADNIVRGAKMATAAKTVSDLETERKKKELDAEQARLEGEATTINKSRSGVSTRVFVGRTKGKGSQVVSWEAFDDSIPESLPKDAQEFVNFTKASEADVTRFLILGYNESNQTAASDPIAEYVNPTWPAEAQNQFRIVVRTYAKGLKDSGMTLEKAVELIKPGFDKQYGTAEETLTA